MLCYFRLPVGWKELMRRTFNESLKDDVQSLAAELAYYFFLSLFPALLFLVAVASFFPVSNLIDEMVGTLGRFAPPDVLQILADQLRKISEGENGGILTFAFLFTIWSSSAAMVSIISTMNRVYGIQDSRPWWKVRFAAVGLTIGVAAFVLVSFALVLVGPTVAEKVATSFNLGQAFATTWKVVQWPIIFALVASAIGLIYYFAPDAEQYWVWLTPGSAFATFLWLVTSLAFKYYVTNFGNYNETYGTIGGIIVLMLWFYLSGLVILIGAELNAEIEHASPHGKDPGEKVPDEKKKLGFAAEAAYLERLERLKKQPVPAPVYATENCTVDVVAPAATQPAAPSAAPRRRFSDLVIGGTALAGLAFWNARKAKT